MPSLILRQEHRNAVSNLKNVETVCHLREEHRNAVSQPNKRT